MKFDPRDNWRIILLVVLLVASATVGTGLAALAYYWFRRREVRAADGERGDASAASEDELTSQVAAPTPDAPPEEGANRASGNEEVKEMEKEEIATRTSFEVATDALGEAPFANQVECHPLLRQEELRAYADANDVELVGYSPLARGNVLNVPEVTAIAEKHGVSAAQVSLAWLREKGVTAIPKATGEDHVRDNWASLGLELDDEDVETIDTLGRTDRQLNPDFGPDW